MLADFARVHSRIVHVFGAALVGPLGVAIDLGRTFHAQCFVGPLLVKLFAPQIQCVLLGGTGLQFHADVAMQALMRPVVLRVAGAAALQIDA